MAKYVLKISYDGARFAGFQRQPNVRTVQGVLEDVLAQALGEEIALSCAGRTDKGVHALGQVVSFKTSKTQPVITVLEATNRRLAPFIQIREVVKSPRGFRPRFSAKSRTYSYYVRGNSLPRPRTGREWRLTERLDLERMTEAGAVFVGEHDFTSFSYRCGHSDNVRRLHDLSIIRVSEQFFRIQVTGSGFLRKMVRLLVAAIVECGQGKSETSDLVKKLERKDPTQAPHPAPPFGLCLESVEYEEDPFAIPGAKQVPTLASIGHFDRGPIGGPGECPAYEKTTDTHFAVVDRPVPG